jgi:hypothetical protein
VIEEIAGAPTSLAQHNGLAFISSIAKCALDAQPNAIGEQVGMAQRMESVAPTGWGDAQRVDGTTG